MSEKKKDTAKTSKKVADRLMAISDIEPYCKLMQKYSLTSLQIENDEVSLSLQSGQVVAGPPQVSAVSAAAVESTVAASKSRSGEPGMVTSPVVGTVYMTPQPDAAPFVKVGDMVKKGQTLLIVESMKVMNQVSSPIDGVVKEILVESSHPVEFGDELMLIG